MSGYDKLKFISLPQSIAEELTCGICLNILNNPMTTPCCRHSYCGQCILQSLRMSCNPNTCPNDRQKLLSKDLIPASRIIFNILDKQEVYCDYKSNGCPQTCQLAQLPQHLIQCSYDPLKSFKQSEQCLQSIESLSNSINKLKNRIKKPEFQQMVQQLEVCNREVQMMAQKISSQTIYVQPNSESFKNKVMESAKNCIESPEIVDCNIDLKSLKKKVIKKCKEAIRQSNDYNQIGQYLIDCLNNGEYDWSVFVYPKHSVSHSLTNFVDKMELSFGDLCIVLVSHHSEDIDDDDDNYTDVGDDYLDYSEDFGDDDDDEEDWPNIHTEHNWIP